MNYQETETVELKKSTSELKEALISLVSMLNKHQRGEVWFGIRNDGTVVGQQISEKTIRDLSKAIADHIEPKIFPVIEPITVEARQCHQGAGRWQGLPILCLWSGVHPGWR